MLYHEKEQWGYLSNAHNFRAVAAKKVTSTLLARVDAECTFLSVAAGKWEGIFPLSSPLQCRQRGRLHHLSGSIVLQTFGYQAIHITYLIYSTLI